MVTFKDRLKNMISEIEYSDSYMKGDNFLLFSDGIAILSVKIVTGEKEFTEEELEILTEIFDIINENDENVLLKIDCFI